MPSIGQRPAVPLVPLVAQTAIYIYMYELSAGTVSHRGRRYLALGDAASSGAPGRLPNRLEGPRRVCRGAGIYRILPEAVCPASRHRRPQDADRAGRPSTALRWFPAGRAAPWAAATWAMAWSWTSPACRIAGSRSTLPPAGPSTSAAVTLAELNAAAAAYGLRLPPDPSSGRWATLGGMVSTNAAGARSVRYGSVRRWVEGTDAGDGGRRDGKAGAWATAGRAGAARRSSASSARRRPESRLRPSSSPQRFPTDPEELVRLCPRRLPRLGRRAGPGHRGRRHSRHRHRDRVAAGPVPPFRAGLRVHLASLDHLSDVVSALHQCEPSALELLDRTFLDLIGTGTGGGVSQGFVPEAILLVELERSDPEALRQVLAARLGSHWALDHLDRNGLLAARGGAAVGYPACREPHPGRRFPRIGARSR